MAKDKKIYVIDAPEGITYDPRGQYYASGSEDSLTGWKKEHIQNALKAGLITIKHGTIEDDTSPELEQDDSSAGD